MESKDKESTAKMIAIGAMKYAMLRISPEKLVFFDWEDVLKLEGNTAGTAVAVDSTGAVYYRSVLDSRRMTLDMAGNLMTAMTAEGAASSYYMHAPTPSGRKMFVNTARGDTIRFFFDGGRISNMRIFGAGSGDAAGKYYEYEPVKEKGTKAQRQKGKK